MTKDRDELMREHFADGAYRDVPGLCATRTRAEIEAQGWSLNPGRYVGVRERAADDSDFFERLQELSEEMEERIAGNMTMLLEGAATSE